MIRDINASINSKWCSLTHAQRMSDETLKEGQHGDPTHNSDQSLQQTDPVSPQMTTQDSHQSLS